MELNIIKDKLNLLSENLNILLTFYYEPLMQFGVSINSNDISRASLACANLEKLASIEDYFILWGNIEKYLVLGNDALNKINRPEIINYFLPTKSEGTLRTMEMNRNISVEMMADLNTYVIENKLNMFSRIDLQSKKYEDITALYNKYGGIDIFMYCMVKLKEDVADVDARARIDEEIQSIKNKILDIPVNNQKIKPGRYTINEYPYLFGLGRDGESKWTTVVPEHAIIIDKSGLSQYDYNIDLLINKKYLSERDLYKEKLSAGINYKNIQKNLTILPFSSESDSAADSTTSANFDAKPSKVYETYDGVHYRPLTIFDAEAALKSQEALEKYNQVLNAEIESWIRPPAITTADLEMQKINNLTKDRVISYVNEEFEAIWNKMEKSGRFDILNEMIEWPVMERVVSRDLRFRAEQSPEYLPRGIFRANELRSNYIRDVNTVYQLVGPSRTGLIEFAGDVARIKQYYSEICKAVIARLSKNKMFDDEEKGLKAVALDDFYYRGALPPSAPR